MHCVVSGIALAVTACRGWLRSTTSKYSYRDVALTITDADSGAPIAQTPFRVVYTYSPYAVELPLPDEVRAETDAEGKAVVKLADYAWDSLLYMQDIGVEGFTGFVLTKEMIANGGMTQSYTYPRLNLDLCPTTQPDETAKYCVGEPSPGVPPGRGSYGQRTTCNNAPGPGNEGFTFTAKINQHPAQERLARVIVVVD